MKWLRYTLHAMLRAPIRPALAVLAVALAVSLFCAVVAVDRGLQRMLTTSARPDVLVVFDRFQSCPPLSKLPAAHRSALEKIDGVRDVTAELFVISSCSRVTDLVAVHGVEPAKIRAFREIELPEADFEAFAGERGAAIVGKRAAARYGWSVGETVSLERLGGLTFTIRGIFEAKAESLESAILVDLEYLQLATNQPGTVTLYHVRVANPEATGAVADAIDRQLAGSTSPTRTAGERAFLDAAVSSLSGLVEFTALLGYGALGLVALGVGNSLSMSIRDRTREIAILKTVGFRRPQVLRLMLLEALVCGVAGGALGAAAAWVLITASRFELSVEGFSFAPSVSPALVLEGLGLSALLAVAAGFFPAFRVARLKVAAALREAD
ncbi:MAG: FtsX-like permease family protein [Terrimicrobiaceae bacterium]|nr:FtsX-like permease family protein [Terrimicrobiaceae bacterium]